MSTGRAELGTTTTAGTVASVVEVHVRGLDGAEPADSDQPPFVRGWTVTGGSGAEVLRVATTARRPQADGTELVDDAESYAQLLSLAEALRAAGFVVAEVLDGWRTVAVDVAAAAAAAPETPTDDATPGKVKKTKKAKAPKPPKPVKTRKAKDTDQADRSGLLRRRTAAARTDSTELESAAAAA